MADTLASNVQASYSEIIERTIAQMPQSAPMLSLARKVIIPKGHNEAKIRGFRASAPCRRRATARS